MTRINLANYLKKKNCPEQAKKMWAPESGQFSAVGAGVPGLRHNQVNNTSSDFKQTRRLCLVETEALFDRDRGAV